MNSYYRYPDLDCNINAGPAGPYKLTMNRLGIGKTLPELARIKCVDSNIFA